MPLRYLYRDFAGSKAFPDQEQWITDQQGLLLLHDRLTAEIDQSRGHVALHPLRDLGGEWAELDWPATLAQDAGELKFPGTSAFRSKCSIFFSPGANAR